MAKYRVIPPEGVAREIRADSVTTERDTLVFTRRGVGLIAQHSWDSQVEKIEEANDDE